jgi:Tfp pilus assembly protein PilX
MYSPGTKKPLILKKNSSGAVLLSVLIIASIFLFVGMVFCGYIINERRMVNLFIEKEKAFYLAEAGIEDAKSILVQSPNWFTDAPHLVADDAKWLMDKATGEIRLINGGSYKMVRESNKNIIYSVGTFKHGKSVLRVKYYRDPFRAYEFKII